MHACKHEAYLPQVKKEFHLDSDESGFISKGISNMGG